MKACLSCVFNHENSLKTFFLPNEQSQAKMCVENHVGNHNVPRWQNMHFCMFIAQYALNWILQCVPISPYNYESESKKVFDISLTVSMGHLIVFIRVPFCPKYLIWRQVLFLNFVQRPEKLFHNVILVIFSLKNVNRTPYLEGNTQLFYLLCKTQW